jgi:peptidoglycan/LPS O-acetylase OafA/YrhL
VLRAAHGQHLFPWDFFPTIILAALSYHLIERPVMAYARGRDVDSYLTLV